MSDEQSQRPIRRRIRVGRELYRDAHTTIAVTISTLARGQLFKNSSFARDAIDSLGQATESRRIEVPIYRFMPDHVHLLLQLGEGSDLIQFVNSYKSWTTRLAWQYGSVGRIWQRSFYDHILRNEESMTRHMRYIVENPVRAGIVEDWREYPFTGSFQVDLKEIDW